MSTSGVVWKNDVEWAIYIASTYSVRGSLVCVEGCGLGSICIESTYSVCSCL